MFVQLLDPKIFDSCRKTFEAIDLDHNGVIDKSELLQALIRIK
jgi:Ca2+-binding EF-hand superfamily protein